MAISSDIDEMGPTQNFGKSSNDYMEPKNSSMAKGYPSEVSDKILEATETTLASNGSLEISVSNQIETKRNLDENRALALKQPSVIVTNSF